MTIQEFLAEQGLTAEESSAIMGSPAQLKAMNAALSRYDEGTTARAQSAAEKAETATFWEQKTQELQGSVNRLTAAERRAAEAEGVAAQRTAYLKSLKDQGYDVPDTMLGTSHVTEPPRPITREEMEQGFRKTAPDLVSLTALSNEYYHLYGEPYVQVEEDFRAAQSAGKPLRDYARTKYGFEAKKAEKLQVADQARIDKIVQERVTAEKATWAAANGSNHETRSPLPSKFDKLQKQPGFKSDSWKSQEGRAANRAERLKRFENVTIQ
jgi:hypothetical protein